MSQTDYTENKEVECPSNARPGVAKIVRVEEWIYDKETGKCVKFCTTEKTYRHSKFRRRLYNVWSNTKLKLRNSTEDFGKNLKNKSSDKALLGVAEENLLPNQSKSASMLSSGNELIDEAFEVEETEVQSAEDISQPEGRGVLQEPECSEQPCVAQSSRESKELEVNSDAEEWYTPIHMSPQKVPDCGNSKVDMASGVPNVVPTDSSVSIDEGENQRPFEVRSTEDSTDTSICDFENLEICHSEVSESGNLGLVSYEEEYFDLSHTTCDWSVVENLVHKANIVSYKRHNKTETEPGTTQCEGITVLGAGDSISYLSHLLKELTPDTYLEDPSSSEPSCLAESNSITEEHQSETKLESPRDALLPCTDDNCSTSESSLMMEIRRMIYFLLEQTSDDTWDRASEEEMKKLVSVLSIIHAEDDVRGLETMKNTLGMSRQEYMQSIYDPEKVDVTHSENIELKTEDPLTGRYDNDIVRDVTSIPDNPAPATVKSNPSVHDQNSNLDILVQPPSSCAGEEKCVGDGLNNSTVDGIALILALEETKMKIDQTNQSNETNSSTNSQFQNQENIQPSAAVQEVYLCTSSPKRSSSWERTEVDTLFSPPQCCDTSAEEPLSEIQTTRSIAPYSNPVPSKFEISFDTEVTCEVTKNLGTWNIRFCENPPNVHDTLQTTSDISDNSSIGKRLIMSSGRHFELSFSGDVHQLRFTSSIQDT